MNLSVKIYSLEFNYILSTHSNFGSNQTAVMGILHEALHAFQCMKVTGWGIISHTGTH
jgi:hypothetical protein